MENSLHLVGSAESVKAIKGKKMTPSDLSEAPLIFREHGSATRNAMEQYLDNHSVKVNQKYELVSNEAVKQAVNAGLGFSIMPLIGLRNVLIQAKWG